MTIKILDNCCSLEYLDYLKHVASNSETWNLRFPTDFSIEEKFLKLDIIDEQNQKVIYKHPFLAGLAMGLLIQIYEAGGQGLFIPEVSWCGISIKDKHRPDNIHIDALKDKNLVKIIGIINSDWKEEWGGGFLHNGISNYIKPTSFGIFDPGEPHAATEIFTDKKRFAIDYEVFRK
tara:strand:+ start:97 stop:624 length:528 start_codon:yes stop_codon:yes gene_type:complete